MARSEFLSAVRSGGLHQVRQCVEHGVSLYERDMDGNTALHIAAAAGHAEIVRFLLAEDVMGRLFRAEEWRNKKKETPAELAASHLYEQVVRVFASDSITGKDDLVTALVRRCKKGDLAAVKLLLDIGVDANAGQPYTHNRGLYQAARNGHVDVAELLLEHGADVRIGVYDTALHGAARASDHARAVEMTKFLLRHGADVNASSEMMGCVLSCALECNNVAVGEVLLEHGADAREVVYYGPNMFQKSCRLGRLEFAQLILKHGTRGNAVDITLKTAMHYAAMGGSTAVLQMLLDLGLDVDAGDSDGKTPLHFASENGQATAVGWLLNHGSNVNARTEFNATPLHSAAEKGHAAVVKSLLAYGADVNARESVARWTALHEVCASNHGSDEVASLLLAHGADVNMTDQYGQTPLSLACLKDDGKIAMAIILEGTDVDVDRVLTEYGTTPLYDACGAKSSTEVVRALLDRGADPHRVALNNRTCLHQACEAGNVEVVQLLLDRGVDIGRVDDDGHSAFYCAAAKCGSSEVVGLLLRNGMDIRLGARPLVMAAKRGFARVVKVLLEHEPFADEDAEYFNSALNEACIIGRGDIVALLLKHGAKASYDALCSVCQQNKINIELVQLVLNNIDPDLPCCSGDTALHIAADKGNHNVVALLLANGLDVNARAQVKHGGTPLHRACRSRARFKKETITTLLKHGADINGRDLIGSTALHLAAGKNCASTVKLLLAHGAEPEMTSTGGYTALNSACCVNKHGAAEALALGGANIDAAPHYYERQSWLRQIVQDSCS